jgi:hypothetical protein
MGSGIVWLVELEKGCWLADIEGDPGRTLHRASAKRFHTEYKAKCALKRARKYRTFTEAEIINEDMSPFVGSWQAPC